MDITQMEIGDGDTDMLGESMDLGGIQDQDFNSFLESFDTPRTTDSPVTQLMRQTTNLYEEGAPQSFPFVKQEVKMEHIPTEQPTNNLDMQSQMHSIQPQSSMIINTQPPPGNFSTQTFPDYNSGAINTQGVPPSIPPQYSPLASNSSYPQPMFEEKNGNNKRFKPPPQHNSDDNLLITVADDDQKHMIDPHALQFLSDPNQMVRTEHREHELLGQVQRSIADQKSELENLRNNQQQLIASMTKDGIDWIEESQNKIKNTIADKIQGLQTLEATELLHPDEVSKLIFLKEELTVQDRQIELYQKELDIFKSDKPSNECLASLCIYHQPLPMVITRGKSLEQDFVVVQLLTASNVEISPLEEVKAILIADYTSTPKTGSPKPMEIESQSLDQNGKCEFHLKFTQGTRKNPETVSFSLNVSYNGKDHLLESEQSHPFVVITNESQYEESDGTLLKKEGFDRNVDIPWKTFANKLQRHFLRAPRQDPLKPTRFLSINELNYFHSKFLGGGAAVSQTHFDMFWSWFGKSVQKIRYQRHVGAMWQQGLIYGFISREGVEELLQNRPHGSFLIRFSERHPGLFAVGYCIQDEIKHYLISPEDLGTKKTLPDFLHEKVEFQHILQVDIDSSGNAKLSSFMKDVVLERYYSKRKGPQKNLDGYITTQSPLSS